MNKHLRLVDRDKPDLFPPPPFFRTWDNEEIINNKFESSDPSKLVFLCQTLSGTDFVKMELKICDYLKEETCADMVFLIHLMYETEEATVYANNGRILDTSLRYSLDKDVLENLIKFNKDLDICNLLDSEIEDILLQTTNLKKCHVVSVPVNCKRYLPPVQILACAVNSKRSENSVVHYVKETFNCCLSLLLNTRMYQEESRIKLQCQQLLSYARKLFINLTDVNDLLSEIMYEARQLTNAERCSLFLLDPDHMCLVAKVFDGARNMDTLQEIKLTRDQGICGHVAVTGKILNIKDAYKHPLFYKGMDDATGFRTRNILCFPIRDEHGIIGVAQLCNKIEGNFNVYDEEAAAAFSVYCGLAIMHSLIYKKIKDEQARNKLSTELMIYHMRISDMDVERVLNCPLEHSEPGWKYITFSPRILPIDCTPCYVVNMFNTFNLVKKFRIKTDNLVRFTLYVQKGYRDAPYHNWWHGFSVCHFVFLCIYNFRMLRKKFISDLEALALMISTMAHDLDHRGTTNSFQMQSESNLASLYSSEGSVMERHHLAQCIFILNTEGCNLLENLDSKQYILCLDFIREMILATDLATHFKTFPKQKEMAASGYNKFNTDHRTLLVDLMMTCADLSDQTKDWSVVKICAECILTEFFSQGDVEKQQGRNPIAMMDREKADIPNDQICFITYVAMPPFQILASIFHEGEIFVKALNRNIEHWKETIPLFEEYWNAKESEVKLPKVTSSSEDVEGEEESDVLSENEEGGELEIVDESNHAIVKKKPKGTVKKTFHQNITYMFKKI